MKRRVDVLLLLFVIVLTGTLDKARGNDNNNNIVKSEREKREIVNSEYQKRLDNDELRVISPAPTSNVIIVHAVPLGTLSVDIFVNNKLFLHNAQFKSWGNYFDANSTSPLIITVTTTDVQPKTLLQGNITVVQDSFVVVAFAYVADETLGFNVGSFSNTVPEGEADIHWFHSAWGVGLLDFLYNGLTFAWNIKYGQITGQQFPAPVTVFYSADSNGYQVAATENDRLQSDSGTLVVVVGNPGGVSLLVIHLEAGHFSSASSLTTHSLLTPLLSFFF